MSVKENAAIVLARYRQEAGLTQKSVDTLLNKRTMYCYDIERRKQLVDLDDLISLLSIYKVSISTFFNDIGSPEVKYNTKSSKIITSNKKLSAENRRLKRKIARIESVLNNAIVNIRIISNEETNENN